MKTAIEELQEMVESKLTMPMGVSFKELFEQAKQMHKQQIIDAYEEGYLQCSIYGLPQKSRKHYETSEKFYNETFKI